VTVKFIERGLWALVLILGLAVAAVLWFWPDLDAPHPSHDQLPLTGVPVGGDFKLSRDGESFSLTDYRGQVVMLYFGYTYCPDVCPTSLAIMRQALRQLGEEQQARVQGVFVSVDPERDSPQRLEEYSGFFHSRILGVSGSEAQLAEAGRLYGAAWQRAESDSAMGYAVDHSSNTYVIGPDGRLAAILPHGTPAERLIATLLPLLNEESP
jgi:protein SCO1/2